MTLFECIKPWRFVRDHRTAGRHPSRHWNRADNENPKCPRPNILSGWQYRGTRTQLEWCRKPNFPGSGLGVQYHPRIHCKYRTYRRSETDRWVADTGRYRPEFLSIESSRSSSDCRFPLLKKRNNLRSLVLPLQSMRCIMKQDWLSRSKTRPSGHSSSVSSPSSHL